MSPLKNHIPFHILSTGHCPVRIGDKFGQLINALAGQSHGVGMSCMTEGLGEPGMLATP